jgi:hypothetical protein
VGDSPLPWTPISEAMVPFEAAMRAEMLAASTKDSTFLASDAGAGAGARGPFDMDAHVGIAAKLLAVDGALSRARYRLVPRRVTEVDFWRNYFETVGRVRAGYRARADAALDARAAAAAAAEAGGGGGGGGGSTASAGGGGTAVSSVSPVGAGAADAGTVTVVPPPLPVAAAAGASLAQQQPSTPLVQGVGGDGVGAGAAVASAAGGARGDSAIAGSVAVEDDGGADFVFVDGGQVDEAVFEAALARALTSDDALDATHADVVPDDGARARARTGRLLLRARNVFTEAARASRRV